MTDGKNAYSEESVNVAEQMIGSFLPRVLHLENLMSNIMTQHFCSHDAGRAVLFLSSITPDMGFRKKINIFMNMMRIYYDEIYNIYESDLRRLYEIDQYRSDLVNLVAPQSEQVMNNNVADTTESLKSRNGKSRIGTATWKEHETKVRLCVKLASILNVIQREIVLGKPS